jgi:hypothetical protein
VSLNQSINLIGGMYYASPKPYTAGFITSTSIEGRRHQLESWFRAEKRLELMQRIADLVFGSAVDFKPKLAD